MTRDTRIARAVRRVVHASALVAAATSLPVYAQDQKPDIEATQTVVVTGSRIQRPELESTTPILALGRQDLESQGLNNVADIAAQLPQFAAAFGASRTQSTFSQADFSGLNQFNLRNLAPERTLSLINGRRSPGGRTVDATLDFNLIPTANIERIELLTGGASAVYGADAVAGVVNLITRKDFRGIEVGANYSATEHGDNRSPGGYIMLGGGLGETAHGTLTIEYQKQGSVICADRYLCAQDVLFNRDVGFERGPAAYSGVGLAASFDVGGPTFYTARNGSYSDASGSPIPFVKTIDGYNRNAERMLAIPTKRTMVAADGEVEIASGITAFTELNYGESKTDAPFEGHPFQSFQAGSQFGTDTIPPGLSPTVPLNNPFVPAVLFDTAVANGLDPATDALDWQQRFSVFQSRGAENKRKMYRGVAGLRGDFESLGGFGSAWSWEVSYLYGRTELDSITDGNVRTDHLYYGLRVEPDPASAGNYRCIDPDARADGCIPINPFAPYTDAEKAYLIDKAGQHGHNELTDITAFINGTLFELPAGGLKAVLGVERRTLAGFLDFDDVINLARVTGNQFGDVDPVKIETKEIFAELNVPILKDMPFAQSLDFSGSFRKSEPKKGDNYNTWGYGLNWQPITGLRLRGSTARAVRTPVPADLSGVGQDFGTIEDPCTRDNRNQTPIRAANCTADGVPDTYNPLQITTQSVAGVVGGNPDLAPEVGDTLTFGFVWTPEFVPGLNLSVDRFRIKVTDVIAEIGRQNKTNLCYDTVERLFCNDVTRGSSPLEPLTPGAVLLTVNDQSVNVARIDVHGYDIELGFKAGVGADRQYGTLSFRQLWTIYDKASKVPQPGAAVDDYLGYAGGDTNDQGWLKRQATTDIRWNYHEFTAGWHMRYIGPAYMARTFEDFGKIGSRIYHDLRFSYDLKNNGSQVYLGIDNVADRDPPFFVTNTSGTQALDTIPAYYDVFGRTYFGGVVWKF